MPFKTREYTRKILAAIEDGLLNRDFVISTCLEFMSESEVREMCEQYGLFDDDDAEDATDGEQDEDDTDGEHIDNFNWVGSRHHY